MYQKLMYQVDPVFAMIGFTFRSSIKIAYERLDLILKARIEVDLRHYAIAVLREQYG